MGNILISTPENRETQRQWEIQVGLTSHIMAEKERAKEAALGHPVSMPRHVALMLYDVVSKSNDLLRKLEDAWPVLPWEAEESIEGLTGALKKAIETYQEVR